MSFSFSAGDVIYLKEVSYTDHPKYHLVLSVSDDLFFIINSDISSTIALNNIFSACQVECKINVPVGLTAKDKSYVACHEIADTIFCIEVEGSLKNRKAINCGKLDEAYLRRVLDVVKNHCSPTITTGDKKTIIHNLEIILKP
jgi:hypothetical protein